MENTADPNQMVSSETAVLNLHCVQKGKGKLTERFTSKSSVHVQNGKHIYLIKLSDRNSIF